MKMGLVVPKKEVLKIVANAFNLEPEFVNSFDMDENNVLMNYDNDIKEEETTGD